MSERDMTESTHQDRLFSREFRTKSNQYRLNDMLIHIQGYQGQELYGNLLHCRSGLQTEFKSFLGLIKAMQQVIDLLGLPQPLTKIRSWEDEPQSAPAANEKRREEVMAMSKMERKMSMPVGGVSFLISIQYRQNSTWQGTIQWLDGKKTRNFRSELEMIRLIEEVVSQSDLPGYEEDNPTWFDDQE